MKKSLVSIIFSCLIVLPSTGMDMAVLREQLCQPVDASTIEAKLQELSGKPVPTSAQWTQHSSLFAALVYLHGLEEMESANFPAAVCAREGSLDGAYRVQDVWRTTSQGYDRFISVIKTADDSWRREIPHSRFSRACAFNHAGTHFAVGDHGTGFKIRIWELESGECTQELSCGGSDVSALAWSHDDTQIISVEGYAYANVVRLWDVQSGQRVHDMNNLYSYIVRHISGVSPGINQLGTLAVVNGFDTKGQLCLLDLELGECVKMIPFRGCSGSDLQFSSDGTKIALTSAQQIKKVWGLSGEVRKDFEAAQEKLRLVDHYVMRFILARHLKKEWIFTALGWPTLYKVVESAHPAVQKIMHGLLGIS